MPYIFTLHRESLKRRFAVYVVVAKGEHDTKLYVGKTGDNRDGCNPLISRCGNHFSYNDIHSQVRNNLTDHESREYTYIFEHFDEYTENMTVRRVSIDRINEMERWLNVEIQNMLRRLGGDKNTLINPFRGVAHVSQRKRLERTEFRTLEATRKITELVAAVREMCG